MCPRSLRALKTRAWRASKLLERETGIEPATNSLEGCDSTTELLPPLNPPSALQQPPLTRHWGASRHSGGPTTSPQTRPKQPVLPPESSAGVKSSTRAHPTERKRRAQLLNDSQQNQWCTGEDSNLRSSQGAADLQSAAINHSATCAEMCRSFRLTYRSPASCTGFEYTEDVL
jgi:hypothetical protein